MKLFGGAISAEIPITLVDASDLREVPDNQEVYVGTFHDFDVSLIIELLEPVEKPNIMDALVYHVEETHRVSDTDQEKTNVLQTLTMKLGKHHYAERVDIVPSGDGWVSLVFGLFRLPEYHTEILITCTLKPQMQSPGPPEVDSQKQVVRNAVTNFKVLDPDLFKQDIESNELSMGHRSHSAGTEGF